MSATRRVTVTRAPLGPEADRIDREFWARMSPDERVEQTWLLSLELWRFKGWDAGEQRLHRSVARVVRG